MTPMPTVWWFRPVSSAARVGAQRAVVWKRLYFRPPAASRSAVGVRQGPPNALDAPKPASSISTMSTLGAPAGGRSGSIGGNLASGSFASNGRSPSNAGSGMGRFSREIWLGTVGSFPSYPSRCGSDQCSPVHEQRLDDPEVDQDEHNRRPRMEWDVEVTPKPAARTTKPTMTWTQPQVEALVLIQ
jgi:hypothetical protein